MSRNWYLAPQIIGSRFTILMAVAAYSSSMKLAASGPELLNISGTIIASSVATSTPDEVFC